jgi:CRISPR-associated protein Cmr1
MLLSLFGGIGARWRRGFGSVQIEDFSYKGKNLEELANELKNKIKDLKEIQVKDNEKLNCFMNITNTKIYLIKPKNDFWNSWESAMNDLRDNFYRKMKNQLKMKKIAYKPSNGEREVSPVIIQIKKTKNNNYFGVVLVYEKWSEFKNFEDKINALTNLEIKEV